MNEWRYYNFALLPATTPDKVPDLSFVNNGSIWKMNKKALLTRWTTDFDCRYETDWWFCIKDTAFDIKQAKAKVRYRINKGLKNTDVRKINSSSYAERIAELYKLTYDQYPERYRPEIHLDQVIRQFKEPDIRDSENPDLFSEYWGVFDIQKDELIGFCKCRITDRKWVSLVQVTIPNQYQKNEENAALVYTLLEEYINSGQYKYLMDGERNIFHETNYQRYLEHNFEFRKAYCKLHLAYRPWVRVFIKTAYPFRSVLKKLAFVKLVNKVCSILAMEEIVRHQD